MKGGGRRRAEAEGARGTGEGADGLGAGVRDDGIQSCEEGQPTVVHGKRVRTSRGGGGGGEGGRRCGGCLIKG